MLMIQHYRKALVGQDINNVSQTLNHDLKSLKEWSDQNRIFINTQKTKFVIGNVFENLRISKLQMSSDLNGVSTRTSYKFNHSA